MPDPVHIPPPGIPRAEVEIDVGLVQRLLDSQHPDLAGLNLRLFGSGWDNTTFRLGDDLAVRLPRRALGAQMIRKEQRWLVDLAPNLPLPIGAPIRKGEPGEGYPWTWSVVPWIEGVSAEHREPDPAEAVRVAEFLVALHHLAPETAPTNVWRGGRVIDRAPSVEERLDRLDVAGFDLDLGTVWSVWNSTKVTPIDLEPTWLHGDLHPRNIIVDEGSVVAIIDWGDLCVGDPATDLAVAWMLFPNRVHAEFRAAYGAISDATWERAQAWAVFFGVVMLDAGVVDDELWAAAGARTLQRVCA